MIQPPIDKRILACPHCRADSYIDFSFYTRDYYHCPICDLIFLSRQNDPADVINYYKNRYFDDYSGDQTSGIRTSVYRHILGDLRRYKKPGSLLDVGCGCGYFLQEAQEHGWNVAGVDPSEKSIELAKTLVGDAAICGTLDDLPNHRRFDVVTLINVLDHMIDVDKQLKQIMGLLNPGGILYLRFPNGAFYTFTLHLSTKCSVSRFTNKFLVFHEYAITPRAIKHCLADLRFTGIEVHNARLAGDYPCKGNRTVATFLYHALNVLVWITSNSLEMISGGRWICGPSLRVLASKPSGGDLP